MSYQEQRSVVSLLSGVVIFALFLLAVLRRYHGLDTGGMDGTALLRWGAAAMLIFIAVSIVGRILIMILFSILYRIIAGEDPPGIEDERDRLIELKVDHIGQIVFILGFVNSMILVVTGSGPLVMLLAIAGAGLLSEMVGETVRIIMYRRGF